jgi:hypothetical protein
MGHPKNPEIFRLAQEDCGQPTMDVASGSDSLSLSTVR